VIRLDLGDPRITAEEWAHLGHVATVEADTASGYGEPAGHPALRRAAAAALAARTGRTIGAERIVVTHGASMALTAAVCATIAPGDPVAVPSPGFPSYAGMIEGCGRAVRHYRADQAVDDIRAALAEGTRMVLLNTPANPTGRVTAADEVAEVTRLAAHHGAVLLCDEVYADLVYAGRAASPGGAGPRVLTVHSVSKSLCLAGLRIGYVEGDPETLAPIQRAHWRLAMTPSGPAQRVAEAALGRAGTVLPMIRDRLRSTRDEVHTTWRAAGLDVDLPESGVFFWLDVGRYGLDAATFVAAAARLDVVVAPGTVFGPGQEHRVRASFVGGPDDVRTGFDRLLALCRRLDTRTGTPDGR
jgi:aspartate aminotransferase